MAKWSKVVEGKLYSSSYFWLILRRSSCRNYVEKALTTFEAVGGRSYFWHVLTPPIAGIDEKCFLYIMAPSLDNLR